MAKKVGRPREPKCTLGRWIDEQLQARNETLQELADRSGVRRSYLSRILSGYDRPRTETLRLIAGALGHDWNPVEGFVQK